MALGRSLASPVCYYRIKLLFKAEPALSGLHTIREHRLFPAAPILFLCSLGATTLPAPGTARGARMGGPEKVLGGFSSHPARAESKEDGLSMSRRALLALGCVGKQKQKSKSRGQWKGRSSVSLLSMQLGGLVPDPEVSFAGAWQGPSSSQVGVFGGSSWGLLGAGPLVLSSDVCAGWRGRKRSWGGFLQSSCTFCAAADVSKPGGEPRPRATQARRQVPSPRPPPAG